MCQDVSAKLIVTLREVVLSIFSQSNPMNLLSESFIDGRLVQLLFSII